MFSPFFDRPLNFAARAPKNLHRTRVGLHHIPVLTVTTTPARANSLATACHQLERGHGLFLFSDAETYRAHPNPLTMPWDSARGTAQETLLDSLNLANPLLRLPQNGGERIG